MKCINLKIDGWNALEFMQHIQDSMMAHELLEHRNFFPQLQRNVTSIHSGTKLVSYTSNLGNKVPIVALIHGYPQSAFWYEHTPQKHEI